MKKVTLYRATDRTKDFASGACFTPDEDVADEYTDNQGYGGADIVAVEIEFDLSEVLSLVSGNRNGIPYGGKARDAWDRLGDALDLDEEELGDLQEDSQKLIEQAIDRKVIRDALADTGVLWVVYEDTFPAGAVTWAYCGRERVVIK